MYNLFLVDIGSPSNGVKLKRRVFQKIERVYAREPGRFCLNLLQNIFDEATLEKSSMYGSKNRERLDRIKIKAIKGI